MFVAKYDENGMLQWAVRGGGAGPDLGNGIQHDGEGNVAIGGQFLGTSTFGSTTLTSMTDPLSSAPSIDVLIARLDTGGNFSWARQGMAPYTDRALDVTMSSTGDVYAVGQFSDTITFTSTYNNNLNNAIFLIKYDSVGTEQCVYNSQTNRKYRRKRTRD